VKLNISFIFPSDSFNPKLIDEFYLSQANAFKLMGFNVFHVNTDDLEDSSIYQLSEDGKSVKIKKEDIDLSTKFIYRGWMLNSQNYEQLNKKFYYQLNTDTDNYLFMHHLPNWYALLSDYTIKSIITNEDNISCDFETSGFKEGFIKDYVKSIKTGRGSIVQNQEDIAQLIENMKQFKGNIEGGLVIREKVNLENESETRYFVLNNQLFSPHDEKNDKLEMAHNIKEALKDKNLFFYSIDIAYTSEHQPILIEVGDGQVSDYTNWDEKQFIEIFKHLKPQVKMKLNG
jgi:hypothetical protein